MPLSKWTKLNRCLLSLTRSKYCFWSRGNPTSNDPLSLRTHWPSIRATEIFLKTAFFSKYAIFRDMYSTALRYKTLRGPTTTRTLHRSGPSYRHQGSFFTSCWEFAQSSLKRQVQGSWHKCTSSRFVASRMQEPVLLLMNLTFKVFERMLIFSQLFCHALFSKGHFFSISVAEPGSSRVTVSTVTTCADDIAMGWVQWRHSHYCII